MKVLLLYPNLPGVKTLPTAYGLFNAILKREGHQVDLFNTTNYADLFGVMNIYKEKSENLNARPYDPRYNVKDLLYSDVCEDFKTKVRGCSPDLIAVSCTEDMYAIAVPLLASLGKDRPPVVAGGTFPTFAPELAIRKSKGGIDWCLIGEGEDALPELCHRLETGKDITDIPGLCRYDADGTFQRNPLPLPANLATLPLPDFSLFDDDIFYRSMQGKIWRMIPSTTIRGCPYTCAYCNAPSTMESYRASGLKYFRKQQIDLVHREIKHFVDTYHADSIYFWAETFLLWTPPEFDAFCEMYEEFKLPFWIQTRTETVTRERFEKLKRLGCLRIGFGVEHGNERFRATMLRRSVKNDLIVERLNIIADVGIPISVNNMIGFPTETRELAFDTVELNRKFRSDGINSYTFVPFSGTPLRKVCEELGLIEPDAVVGSVMGRSVLNMPQLLPDEIEGVRRCLVLYVKMPRNRWKTIKEAEALTPEGDRLYEELKAECLEKYMFYGDYDQELSKDERAPTQSEPAGNTSNLQRVNLETEEPMC